MAKKRMDANGSSKSMVEAILKDLKEVAKKLSHTPRKSEYLKHGQFREWQIRKFFGGYSKVLSCSGLPKPPADVDLSLRLNLLKQENERLRKQITETESRALTSEAFKTLIGSTSSQEFGRRADWLKGLKSRKRTTGIPMLMISDIHYDEVVKPEQIGGCNAYNREIADARIKHTFKTAISMLKYHMVSPTYEGVIVNLGGDLLSGNIHEELAETNEACINQSIISLTQQLIDGIGAIADEFHRVAVVGVVGNHGRMHKKPRMKNRVFDNFEWLIYQYLVRYFKNDQRISFLIPEGSDAQYSIYDRNFLLTHGDQFRGGTGISGLFSPLMLGFARKQKRQQAIGQPFDVMMMGHWHQYIHADSLIVNGSIKGYDEYAYQLNLPFERPQQALWIMHRDWGVTFRIPVICDSYQNPEHNRKTRSGIIL